MATQPAWLSLEDFHRQYPYYDSDKPYYEYWYGRAIRKPMANWLHTAVQFILSVMLDRLGWTVGPEVRLTIVKEAEAVPDIVAIRGKAQSGHQTTPPELCVEILSRSKDLKQTLWKAHRYLEWGTQFVWIVDPKTRTAWHLTTIEGKVVKERISSDGVLTASLDTSISLAELFEQVDKRVER